MYSRFFNNVAPSDLPVHETRDGITIVTEADWDDAQYGEDGEPDFDTAAEDLKEWCLNHNVAYYGDVRERFDLNTAVLGAQDQGSKYVIVNDLS